MEDRTFEIPSLTFLMKLLSRLRVTAWSNSKEIPLYSDLVRLCKMPTLVVILNLTATYGLMYYVTLI